MKYVIFTTIGKTERYWTGEFSSIGEPILSFFPGHLAFDTAREAYDRVLLDKKDPATFRNRPLQSFRVGKRFLSIIEQGDVASTEIPQ